ncbi:BTAD domain-containing putative transcriptional regulator [Dactylosporangium sp. NPDC005572]|uniref:AfsR/SARP family transcriptional regulator n=1 Tax=Dactylosporangium sp. NPDC005572 TaxID=3156889 RepID=UPI0033B28CEF
MRALWAAGWMLAALVALLWLLLTLTQQLLASDIDVAAVVDQPLNAVTAIAAVTATGWLLLIWLLVTVIRGGVAEVRRLRHRTGVHPQGHASWLPVPLHAAVTSIAGATVLLVDALNSTAAAPGPLPPPAGTAPGPVAVPALPAAATTATPPKPAAQPPPAPLGQVGAAPPSGRAAAPVDHRNDPADQDRGEAGGGWLPAPTRDAIAAATGSLWLRRRSRYQPQTPRRANRRDADPPPVLHLPNLDPDTPSDVPPEFDETDHAASVPAPCVPPSYRHGSPVIGVADQHWLHLTDLPPAGLGLIGPGAGDALRGLLITILAAHATRDASPPVIMTATDARTLLGVDPTGLPGLRLVPADRDLPPTSSAGDPRGHTPGQPNQTITYPHPALAIQPAPSSQPHDRDPHPTVVFHGQHPPATTWHVAATGHTTPADSDQTAPTRTTQQPPTVRLATLNPAAAAALATLLRETPKTRQPSTDPGIDRPTTSQPRHSGPPPAFATNGAHPGPSPAHPPSPAPPNAPLITSGPRRLQIHVLGTVQVRCPRPDGDASPVHIRRTGSVELLAYLAVQRRMTTAGTLKHDLLPGIGDSIARRRLATNMSELRSTLRTATGQDVLRREPDPTGGRYWLDPDRVHVDLWHCQDLLDTADTTPDPNHRHRLLHEAADLDGGELCHPLTGHWLDAARDTMSRHWIDLYTHLADLEPDHRAAIGLLRRALRIAPHNENLYRAAMRRYAAAGDDLSIHRLYATATECLAELHTTPDSATRQLYETLTMHDATHQSVGTLERRTR